jgi:hypothetical protein
MATDLTHIDILLRCVTITTSLRYGNRCHHCHAARTANAFCIKDGKRIFAFFQCCHVQKIYFVFSRMGSGNCVRVSLIFVNVLFLVSFSFIFLQSPIRKLATQFFSKETDIPEKLSKFKI